MILIHGRQADRDGPRSMALAGSARDGGRVSRYPVSASGGEWTRERIRPGRLRAPNPAPAPSSPPAPSRPGLHLRLAAQKVEFEAKAAVNAAVDPFQCATPIVATPPGRLPWGVGVKLRRSRACSGRCARCAHTPRPDNQRPGTTLPALAGQAVGCRRTAILQRPPASLEALKRHRPLLPVAGQRQITSPFSECSTVSTRSGYSGRRIGLDGS